MTTANIGWWTKECAKGNCDQHALKIWKLYYRVWQWLTLDSQHWYIVWNHRIKDTCRIKGGKGIMKVSHTQSSVPGRPPYCAVLSNSSPYLYTEKKRTQVYRRWVYTSILETGIHKYTWDRYTQVLRRWVYTSIHEMGLHKYAGDKYPQVYRSIHS